MKCVLTCVLIFAGALAGQDQAGGLGSRQLSLRHIAPAEQLKAAVTVPRGYAVVIGVSSYKNLARDQWLSYAEKDAETLYSTLIDKQAGNFEFENVVKLTGPQATLANIRDTLENWLPAKAQEGDRVVVFYVGHGVVDGSGRGYLAPYDIDPDHLAQTGYPMDRLGQVLSQRVKSSRKFLLVDACHSGKVATPGGDFLKVNESLRALPQVFLTLASSRAGERSYEDPSLAGGNGVFTYFLTQGWKGEADTDPADGIVTADELLAYVKREVRLYVKARGGQQNPVEFGDFPDDLLLGFSSQRRQEISRTLPELANGSLVVEANLDGVDVSVDDQRQGTASPGKPLRVPGLSPGKHVVRGARMGYEPVSVEVNVVPGTSQTVSLRLLVQRTVKPSARALYDQGEKIWRTSNASKTDLRNAADLYSRALKEQPDYGQALLGLCRVQQAQGETEDALKNCRRAVMGDEDFVDARLTYGTLLMETGDYQEAVRQLQRAAQQDAKNSFADSLLAEALYLADRPEEAEKAANQAIALDESSAQAYLLRAEARRAQSKFDDAAEDYHRVLKLQEYGSGILRVAAFWAIGTGMQKHRSGRRVIYRSQAESAYYGLCACENGLEDYQHAIGYCNRVLGLDKNDSDTYLLLSESYTGLFNRDNRRDYLLKAKENIEATLRINPNIDKAPQLKTKLRDITEILSSLH
jgi:tetratricopeptide (TPR) repeat protein